MSNFLAPATVTAALQLMLSDGIAAEGAGMPGSTNVVINRPDAVSDPDQPQVSIYLYQVVPNPQWRNADLPTRGGRGELLRNPRAAIDLHYLLTFFGNETQLEPQRIMGSVVHLLNDEPVLTTPRIVNAINAVGSLATSNLANEIERVKFTPIAYSLEELSKLWSVFGDTSYRLSVAYSASVVFVEASAPIRPPALPVQEREVIVVPWVDLSPPPTPDLIEGLATWLVSDREITFDVEGVSTWNDLSGQGNHAVQPTVNQRPQFVAHGLGRRPVLRWEAANDELELGLVLNPPLDGLTVALVVRMAQDSSQLALTFNGFAELRVSNGADPPIPTWQTTAATPQLLPAGQGVNDTNWHAIIGRYSVTGTPNKQLFIDGALAGEVLAHGGSPLGSASSAGRLTAVAPAAEVAEIIIYDRALTEAERAILEGYFADRYG